MSEGFEILEYKLLPDDAANAMSIVAAADYSLTFRPVMSRKMKVHRSGLKSWFNFLIQTM